MPIDVGSTDHVRVGDRYALFGESLADRTGQIAGFALRGVCEVVTVGDLVADCAFDRGAWPSYGVNDWQRGGPAHPVDAPAVGDLLNQIDGEAQ